MSAARSATTKTFRAKLFRTGGSQAVRLPKQCRMPGAEVTVRREGQRLIIEPLEASWSPEFVKAFLEDRAPDVTFPPRLQPRKHEREKLPL
jgi:antitoxin VapB